MIRRPARDAEGRIADRAIVAPFVAAVVGDARVDIDALLSEPVPQLIDPERGAWCQIPDVFLDEQRTDNRGRPIPGLVGPTWRVRWCGPQHHTGRVSEAWVRDALNPLMVATMREIPARRKGEPVWATFDRVFAALWQPIYNFDMYPVSRDGSDRVVLVTLGSVALAIERGSR